jgi:hypothetical protein
MISLSSTEVPISLRVVQGRGQPWVCFPWRVNLADSSWGFPQQDSGRDDFWRRVLLPKNLLAASARAPYALIRAVVRFLAQNSSPEPLSERAVRCQWHFDGV